jgi:hypothetical protein
MFRRRDSYGKVSKTDKGEQFLLLDSKDKDRILMFATRRNLDFLIKSQEWFVDGTFKIVPKLFYQLFTIHGNINGAYYPLIYCCRTNEKVLM